MLAASISTVSAAIAARLAEEVPGLSASTVRSFDGSVEALLDQAPGVPFVGLALEKAACASCSSDNSLATESLSFSLTVIAEDFRGRGYSIESSYGLIDAVRDALMGQNLGLEDLAPLEVSEIVRDSSRPDQGISLFRVTVRTWQVRQKPGA